MWRGFVLSILVAGCAAQLPLTPEDIRARKFESVPDQAVIYLVRDSLDSSDVGASIYLGEKLMITTYPGTYFRWVVPAGAHRIVGAGADPGRITVDVQSGRIYFVQQQVTLGGRVIGISNFELVSEANGRAAVLRSVLLAAP